ncbi:MAG: helix-turn-helix domain-containing protein [Lachnospiraceae bacterium]|nr:helix-turn-helix domain-containing protein [Lachnospiraceae bacterium]
MNFAENLRTIRKEQNISQEELAEMLDVSRQAVSKWESGNGYPEVEKLLIISEKLNVSLDALMGNEVRKTEAAVETKQTNPSGEITITSPNEGVIVRCSSVIRSQKYKGGKNSPKFALFAQQIPGAPRRDTINTFLGWYSTEESVTKEIGEIMKAMNDGQDTYELKYSVKVKRSFLSVKLEE